MESKKKSHNACYRSLFMSRNVVVRGGFLDGSRTFSFDANVKSFSRQIVGSRFTPRDYFIESLVQTVLECVQSNCDHQIVECTLLSVVENAYGVYSVSCEFELSVQRGGYYYDRVTKSGVFRCEVKD